MRSRVIGLLTIAATLVLSAVAPAQTPLGAAFTYQGQLKQNGSPYSGSCDFIFILYNESLGGNQQGGILNPSAVAVSNGLFTVPLDFGVVFTGDKRWLDIQVKCPAGSGSPVPLGPRQELTATPYAAYSYQAGSASSAPWNGLTGVPSLQQRVTGTCPAGQSIRVIAADGNVSCQADTNSGGTVTAVTASAPLASSGGIAPNITLTSPLPMANGGTGSAAQNFVDLSTGQAVGGAKTFSSAPSFAAAGTPFSVSNSGMVANLNADQLDGQHATSFQQHYQNIRVVAKSGGDYTTITAALAAITNASATNPYLVYVAPGVYTEQVTMKPYVDIQGSGELTTKITFTGSAFVSGGSVVEASNAELRYMAVENTGGSTYSTAIYNSSASPRLTHVTATASGGTSNYGVFNASSSSPTMTDVTATASGGSIYNFGVYNSSSSPTIQNSTISATGATGNRYGILNYASNGSYVVLVNNSQITGTTNTIFNNAYFTTRIGASKLDGGAVYAGGGTMTCAGVFNASYSFFASTCP